MTPEVALLDAIRADPDDAAPQLVIADWLLAQGDARGELIVLDHRDREGSLGDDLHALERLLFLAAEYTFPCVRDADPPPLAFRPAREPMSYDVECDGRHYHVSFDYGRADLEYDPHLVIEPMEEREIVFLYARDGLELPRREVWSADEALVILTIIGDAIRANTPLDELLFPWSDDALPVYDGGPLRAYRLPHACGVAYGLPWNRYGLAARDYHRWHALWDRVQRLRRR